MKKLTKVLAALMLVGFGFSFNAHANGSCGFDGNNPGGLSFSECVRQEYLKTGKMVFNKNIDNLYYYFGNSTLEEGIAKINKDTNDNISVGVYTKAELKKLDFRRKSFELYLRTFSIQEIRRIASQYNTAGL
jgi:hypothetical protein